MIRAGVTDEAIIPGELIEIPQVRETFRYITILEERSSEKNTFTGFLMDGNRNK